MCGIAFVCGIVAKQGDRRSDSSRDSSPGLHGRPLKAPTSLIFTEGPSDSASWGPSLGVPMTDVVYKKWPYCVLLDMSDHMSHFMQISELHRAHLEKSRVI